MAGQRFEYDVEYKGRIYTIEGPEGATPEQLRATVQKAAGATQAAGGTPTRTPPVVGAPELSQGDVSRPGVADGSSSVLRGGAATQGIGDAAIRGVLGIKQLGGGLNAQDQAVLREIQQDEAHDPEPVRRFGGNVLGNALMMAIPASRVSNLLSRTILPTQAFPRAASLVNTMLTSGATGAMFTPGKGDTPEEQMADRGAQAGEDMLAGGLIHQGGRILRRALVQPFEPTEDARRLMAQGITPTLQQGARGTVGRFIGGLLPESKRVADRQTRELLNAQTRRATTPMGTNAGTDLDGVPLRERSGLVDQQLASEHDHMQGNRSVLISPRLRDDIQGDALLVQSPTGQFENESRRTEDILRNIMGQADVDFNTGQPVATHERGGTFMRNYLVPLANRISVETNPRIRAGLEKAYDRLVAARNQVIRTWPEQETMDDLDSRMYDAMRMRDATRLAGPDAANPQVTPRVLGRAYAQASRGVRPPSNHTQQDLVDPAVRTLADNGGTEGRGTLAAALRGLGTLGGGAGAAAYAGGVGFSGIGAPALAAYGGLLGVSKLGQTKQGARYLFGDMDSQIALRNVINRVYPYLGAPAGATMTPNMEEN